MLQIITSEFETNYLENDEVLSKLVLGSPVLYNILFTRLASTTGQRAIFRIAGILDSLSIISAGISVYIGENGAMLISHNGISMAAETNNVSAIQAVLTEMIPRVGIDVPLPCIVLTLFKESSKNCRIKQMKDVGIVSKLVTQETTTGQAIPVRAPAEAHPLEEDTAKAEVVVSAVLPKIFKELPKVSCVGVLDIPKKEVPETLVDDIVHAAKCADATKGANAVKGARTAKSADKLKVPAYSPAVCGRNITALSERLISGVRVAGVTQKKCMQSVAELIDYMYPKTAQYTRSEVVEDKLVSVVKDCLSEDCLYINGATWIQGVTAFHSNKEFTLSYRRRRSWGDHAAQGKMSVRCSLVHDAERNRYSLSLVHVGVFSSGYSSSLAKELGIARTIIGKYLELLQNPKTVVETLLLGIVSDSPTAVSRMNYSELLQYKTTVAPGGFIVEEGPTLLNVLGTTAWSDSVLEELTANGSRVSTLRVTLNKSIGEALPEDYAGKTTLMNMLLEWLLSMISPVVYAIRNRIYYSLIAAKANAVLSKKVYESVRIHHSVSVGAPVLACKFKGNQSVFTIHMSIFKYMGGKGHVTFKTMIDVAKKNLTDLHEFLRKEPVYKYLKRETAPTSLTLMYDIPHSEHALYRYAPGVKGMEDLNLIYAMYKESLDYLKNDNRYLVTNSSSIKPIELTNSDTARTRGHGLNGFWINRNEFKSSMYGPRMAEVDTTNIPPQNSELVVLLRDGAGTPHLSAPLDIDAIFEASAPMLNTSQIRFAAGELDTTQPTVDAIRAINDHSMEKAGYDFIELPSNMRTAITAVDRNSAAFSELISDKAALLKVLGTDSKYNISLHANSSGMRGMTVWNTLGITRAAKTALNVAQDAGKVKIWYDLASLTRERGGNRVAFPILSVLAESDDLPKYLRLGTPMMFKNSSLLIDIFKRALCGLTTVGFLTETQSAKAELAVDATTDYVPEEYSKFFKKEKINNHSKNKAQILNRLRKMREDYASLYRREVHMLRKEHSEVTVLNSGKGVLLQEEQSLSSLMRQGAIEGFRVCDDTLVVKTPEINLYVGPFICRIGRFTISINGMLSNKLKVMFYNLSGGVVVDEYGRAKVNDHPHVRDGQPCMGNLETFLSQAMERKDFVTIVSLCKSYLNTVNLDDSWGKTSLSVWPKVYATVNNIISYGVVGMLNKDMHILLHRSVSTPEIRKVGDIDYATILSEYEKTTQGPITCTSDYSQPTDLSGQVAKSLGELCESYKMTETAPSGKTEEEIKQSMEMFQTLIKDEGTWNINVRGLHTNKEPRAHTAGRVTAAGGTAVNLGTFAGMLRNIGTIV